MAKANDSDNAKAKERMGIDKRYHGAGIKEEEGWVTLSRPIFRKSLQQSPKNKKLVSIFGNKIRSVSTACCEIRTYLNAFLSLFPVLTWFPSYSWRNELLSDVLAGLTVGIMSIPQGMAYARLAGMPPVYGLYTNIMPTFVYFLMGTAKHAAIGPATVLSLILGGIRFKHIPCEDCWLMSNSTNHTSTEILTPIQIGSAVAFLVGVFLIIMGLLRLAFISDYLPDQLVGGFTVACAVQVLAGQLKAAFGIPLPHRNEIGDVVLRFIDLFSMIRLTNAPTFIIFASCFVILIISKHVINPKFQKKLKIPFPGEFIVMLGATILSYFCRFGTVFKVKTVNHIDPGFPSPEIPKFSIMHMLVLDSFVLAVEFYAYGTMNFVGSFFQCFNSGQSVARSMVYEMAGAKSQLCGMIGTVVVLITILFIAPFLESLPNASLAAIIATAALEMFHNLKELPRLFKRSKYDFCIYVVSLVSVVLLDVTYGLFVSVTFAMLTVVLRSQRSTIEKTNEESFLLCSSHEHQDSPQNLGLLLSQNDIWQKIKVLRLTSPLFYLNADKFKHHLLEQCLSTAYTEPSVFMECISQDSTAPEDFKNPIKIINKKGDPLIVVLDMASVAFIDLMGISALKEAKERLQQRHIPLYLCGCKEAVRTMINRNISYNPNDFFFPSVLDGISYARVRIQNDKFV